MRSAEMRVGLAVCCCDQQHPVSKLLQDFLVQTFTPAERPDFTNTLHRERRNVSFQLLSYNLSPFQLFQLLLKYFFSATFCHFCCIFFLFLAFCASFYKNFNFFPPFSLFLLISVSLFFANFIFLCYIQLLSVHFSSVQLVLFSCFQLTSAVQTRLTSTVYRWNLFSWFLLLQLISAEIISNKRSRCVFVLFLQFLLVYCRAYLLLLRFIFIV